MDISETLKERGDQYGPFILQAGVAQTFKKAARACPNWYKLQADQREAIEHIFVKLARIITGNPDHVDSWHDIAGYATLVERRISKPKEPDVE